MICKTSTTNVDRKVKKSVSYLSKIRCQLLPFCSANKVLTSFVLEKFPNTRVASTIASMFSGINNEMSTTTEWERERDVKTMQENYTSYININHMRLGTTYLTL